MRSIWMIWYAIILHWVWGIMLLSSNSPLNITAIHAMTQMHMSSAPVVGILYLLSALLAVVALAAPRIVGAILLIPQQLLLTVSAIGALMAMFSGSFADGVIRPIPFLVADQAPAVVAAVCHFLSVYANYLTAEK